MTEYEKNVIKAFISWFEDSLGEETYQHNFTDDEWEFIHDTYSLDEIDRLHPDGTEWRSYITIPEFVNLRKLIE